MKPLRESTAGRPPSGTSDKARGVAELLLAVLITTGLLSLACVGVFIWFVGSKALPDNIGFGYYRDFNIARKAIVRSSCAESIEYSRHEDVTLEDFHFKIRTESGLVVRFWFSYSMDVREVCSSPPGFVVWSHTIRGAIWQRYENADLSALLSQKGIRVTNLDDALCRIDELASVFRANYNNVDIPLITHEDADFDRYLQIEIVEAGRGDEFLYSRIR